MRRLYLRKKKPCTLGTDETGVEISASTIDTRPETPAPYQILSSQYDDISHPQRRVLKYIPPLAHFCIRALVGYTLDPTDEDFPEFVLPKGRAQQQQPEGTRPAPDLLTSLYPSYDPSDGTWTSTTTHPDIWMHLISLYTSSLPPTFRILHLPLEDPHVLKFQAITPAPRFSLLTILNLSQSNDLSDDNIIDLHELHNLTSLDMTRTNVSSRGIAALSRTLCVIEGEEVGSKRLVGSWRLRMLYLAGCWGIDDTVCESLQKWPLLFLVDLRRTSCKNPKVTSWGSASTITLQDIKTLLAPELPMNILKNLQTSCPHLFPTQETTPSKSPSSFPYFLSVDRLYHHPHHHPTTTEPSGALYSFVPPIEPQTKPERSRDQEIAARYVARLRWLHGPMSPENQSDTHEDSLRPSSIDDLLFQQPLIPLPLSMAPWSSRQHQVQRFNRRATIDTLSAQRGRYVRDFLMKDNQEQRRTFVLTRHPPPYTSTLSQIVQRSINEEVVRETHVEREKMFSGDASIPAGWGNNKKKKKKGTSSDDNCGKDGTVLVKPPQIERVSTPTTSGTPAPPRITPFGRPAHPKEIQPPLSTSTSSGSIRAGLLEDDDGGDPDIVQDGHENRIRRQRTPASSRGRGRESFPLATVPAKRRLVAELGKQQDESRDTCKKPCAEDEMVQDGIRLTPTSSSIKKVGAKNQPGLAQMDLRNFMMRK